MTADVVCKAAVFGRVVVASGYFSWLHVGHVRYLEAAASLGDTLIVIVNTDHQTSLKGSTPVSTEQERLAVIRSLACVNLAILSIDQDRSVSKTLEMLHRTFGVSVFANGGDVERGCVREQAVCDRLGIEVVCGVGGADKLQSSSWLISKASVRPDGCI